MHAVLLRAAVALSLLLTAAVLLPTAQAGSSSVGCSTSALTDAVQRAGSNGQDDELLLDPGCTYALTAPLVVAADGGRSLLLRSADGSGATLDGGGRTQLLRTAAGVPLTVSGLVLRGGRARDLAATSVGGAVEAGGPLVLDQVTVEGGVPGTQPGGAGVAVRAPRGLRAVGSTFAGNDAGPGSVVFGADLAVTVSTFTGSSRGSTALEASGGHLRSVTIGRNAGTGLAVTAGSLTVVSSVLSENATACGTANGQLLDGGANVVNDTSCRLGSGSRQATAARLLPLAANGGRTRTLALPADSPARSAGNGPVCRAPESAGGSGGFDQRGFPRPDQGDCDAGAVENGPRLRTLAPVDFGDVLPGTTTTRPLDLVNDGDEPLVLGTVSVDGSPELTVSGTCSGVTVGPGRTCTATLQYAPLLPGADEATLTVPTNQFGPPRTTPVRGNATTAAAPPGPAPGPSATTEPPSSASPDASPSTPPSPEASLSASPDPSPSTSPDATPSPSPDATPSPTASPSASPSAAPSSSPSASPSASPSGSPSTAPSPSASASASPGGAPSVGPVLPPGPSATASPSASPGPLPSTRPASDEQDLQRSPIARRLRPLDEVDLSPSHLATNSLLALLLLALIGLPLTVLNATLERHRLELAAMLVAVRRPFQRLRPTGLRPSQPVLYTGLALLATTVYSQLSPDFGLDEPSAVLFVGLLLTIVATSVLTKVVMVAFLVARLRTWATLRLFPGFLLLAITCVVVSRTLELSPGLVLGTLGGLAVARTLTDAERGLRIAFAYGTTLVMALYAYVAWGPVSDAAQLSGSSFALRVLDASLANVALGGLEVVALGLVPLRYLDGALLRAWNARLWAAMWGGAVLLFVTTVVNPTERDDDFVGREDYLGVLLAVYLLLAALVWGGFRWYDHRNGGRRSLVMPEAGAGGSSQEFA